jgi:hypothetical protein
MVPLGGNAANAVRLARFTDDGVQTATKLSEPTVDLFRAVSPEEFYDIQNTGLLRFKEGAMEAKQFGLSFDETLRFADTDTQYAAIIKVQIPQSTLDNLSSHPVDTFIFKSGTATAEGQGQLKLLNSTAIVIEHAF